MTRTIPSTGEVPGVAEVAKLVAKTRTEPLAIVKDVRIVDDAGDEHFETIMTAGYILQLIEDKLLLLENNIRPDHRPGAKMGTKTRRKIDTWASELMQNDAVIGNISIRVDPDSSFYYVIEDEDGNDNLILYRGNFDCAIDSLSRIKAIVKAAQSPGGSFDPGTRFAVRIWQADEDLGRRVAAIYNTRGDKVNDSTAKYAWQSTAEQRIARKLMNESLHLTVDNVEILTNTVSASSHKLFAFNTLSEAIERFWDAEPLTEKDEDEQVAYLVRFWDELVRVRPEFGRLPKSGRTELRGQSMAGTALSIHGVIAIAYDLYRLDWNLRETLARLKEPELIEIEGGTREVDYFSYDNPTWVSAGLLVPGKSKDGEERKTLRMSFQTRNAMANELRRKIGIPNE